LHGRSRNKVLAVEPPEAVKPRGEWGEDFDILSSPQPGVLQCYFVFT